MTVADAYRETREREDGQDATKPTEGILHTAFSDETHSKNDSIGLRFTGKTATANIEVSFTAKWGHRELT